ncbi:MAG TPA: Spy/CpxP family protein refolding chaperone [Caulobacteraceae bacterium]|nr:Spy/CpxP family protein refolding chaperone [Caulobacteraceae bacterium]
MMLAAGRVALVAGLSLPLALATASFAQPAAQTPRSAPPAAADHHHGGYRHHDRGDHEETAAARADRLRTLLQLRSDQEPALSAFVASTAPGAGPQPEDVDAERALPAPERMERMLARMDAVRAQMGQKLAALKTFYAQLTPSQQKAFDALDVGHGRGRGMGGMQRGGMGGGHPGGMGGDHHGGPGAQ